MNIDEIIGVFKRVTLQYLMNCM